MQQQNRVFQNNLKKTEILKVCVKIIHFKLMYYANTINTKVPKNNSNVIAKEESKAF